VRMDVVELAEESREAVDDWTSPESSADDVLARRGSLASNVPNLLDYFAW